jgi:hypothetical protein
VIITWFHSPNLGTAGFNPTNFESKLNPNPCNQGLLHTRLIGEVWKMEEQEEKSADEILEELENDTEWAHIRERRAQEIKQGLI